MKRVEEYLPLVIVVILFLLLILAVVTGAGEETEPNYNATPIPRFMYKMEYPDIDNGVYSPLRDRTGIYGELKR